MINWIQDFLSDRTQVVGYNDITSSTELVLSGTPQGTVIGPVSFLSFISDLPDEVISRIFLFADDTVGVGDGTGGSCPQNSGKYFSGKSHVKFGHFVKFFRAYIM